MPDANAIARKRQDVAVTADDLLCCPEGPITEAGPRQNLNVGLGYLEAWLCGNGCVPLYNLMEDAAATEIGRRVPGSHRRAELPRMADDRGRREDRRRGRLSAPI
jgi:hypothetical protein